MEEKLKEGIAVGIVVLLVMNLAAVFIIGVSLNNSLNEIRDSENSVAYQLHRLSLSVEMLNYKLDGVEISESSWKDQLDPTIDGTNITFTYYDNYEEKLKTSPTFTPENWTDLPDWTKNEHPETFTQSQKNEIMLLTMNLAYYKETGTWLGE